MDYDLNQYPYASQRRLLLGRNGAVATSQPLATLAGMEMFLAGGNAVDAAIASAIALTVVEPTSNGIGGDAFALVWDGKVWGINGSGKSPQHWTQDDFAGLESIPQLGWLTVTVPGAVALWRSLWEKWGKLPFEQLFAPAIRLSEQGFAVSPLTALAWQGAEKIYLPAKDPLYQPFQAVFFPNQRAPRTGEIWGSPVHGATLQEIAATGGESFYRGKLAAAIALFAAKTSGKLTQSDLARHQSLWVEPIVTTYNGLEVWEIPPNGQGIAALMALNILESVNLASYPRDSVESFHFQIEAMKLAFADAYSYVADGDFMQVRVAELLSKNYAEQRSRLLQENALSFAPVGLPAGGTVYLCTGDQELMVSLIQSNYAGFGSGILIPQTGIALHNRGAGFSLQSGHPNQVAGAKRPLHTIMPGFLTQAHQPLGPFGVMGAAMQPQGHLQMVVNLADYGMNPQAALDAPRWRFLQGNRIIVEANVSGEIRGGLRQKGHEIETAPAIMFGKGQMILQRQGVLVTATEPRADGLGLVY